VKKVPSVWLEQSQVAHYLVSLGLVNPRAVIEEDLRVTDVSRRNSVFVTTTSAGPTYVVKQCDPDAAASLDNEAAILRRLAAVPALAGVVPRLAHHGPGRLVLRSPGDAQTLLEYRRPPRLTAAALGGALAAVHQVRLDAGAAQRERLWGLWLTEPSPHDVSQMSAAALDLLGRVQGSAELCERLTRLREGLAEDALVHGDLRWENCLTHPAPGARRRTRVLLIDWELAGPGEPAADLGTAVGEYLRRWVDSIPKVQRSDTLRFAGRAGHPLERLWPAIHALLDGYRRPIELARVMQFAAVRLLQTAFEYAQGLVRPTGDVVALVQVADNILRRPDHAASLLIGSS
jgi:aminoglycoside phosphotransferase (APT) family kinase protein